MRLVRIGPAYCSDRLIECSVEAKALARKWMPAWMRTGGDLEVNYLLIDGEKVPFWRYGPWSKNVIMRYKDRYYRLPFFFSTGTAFVDGGNEKRWPRYYTPKNRATPGPPRRLP